jgi:hypothetical protein
VITSPTGVKIHSRGTTSPLGVTVCPSGEVKNGPFFTTQRLTNWAQEEPTQRAYFIPWKILIIVGPVQKREILKKLKKETKILPYLGTKSLAVE